MATTKYFGQRFMVSPDGLHADWFYGHETAACLGWADCTDMDAEQLQRFIAERQAVRPYVVGVALGA